MEIKFDLSCKAPPLLRGDPGACPTCHGSGHRLTPVWWRGWTLWPFCGDCYGSGHATAPDEPDEVD